MGKLMKARFVSLVTLAALLGAVTLTPKAVVSQAVSPSHVQQIETIDGLPVVRSMASYYGPTDINGLIKDSDLVVIGKIEQSLEEAEPLIGRDSEGGISSANSLVNMTVKKVFKGSPSLKNQTIKVGQSIAIVKEPGKKTYIQGIENVAPYQKGRYLLFLTKANGADAYFANTLFYGRHNLDGTDTSEEKINSPSYQELRKLVRQRLKDDNL